jgi:hypothetical protein
VTGIQHGFDSLFLYTFLCGVLRRGIARRRKRISKANQELFAKEENSLASGIKRCKRGK